eukprot:2140836-Rhodomonas_salina.1
MRFKLLCVEFVPLVFSRGLYNSVFGFKSGKCTNRNAPYPGTLHYLGRSLGAVGLTKSKKQQHSSLPHAYTTPGDPRPALLTASPSLSLPFLTRHGNFEPKLEAEVAP